ncbi:MAG: hypothetical protein HY679_08055 [Chloroflexi bacterium]|nr:hypothetical protein [Chloroflexota bacterium]MBI4315873.1 hypothetical protein [Chloroflexota bacterium]
MDVHLAIPGSYPVRAAPEDAETATADLTVPASASNAGAGPALVMSEPSGEPHAIDRPKPVSQIIAAMVVIALGATGGSILIRSQR